MPNKPKTPVRSWRIPDEIYRPAKAKADAEGDNLADIIKDAFLDYVGDDPQYAYRPAGVDAVNEK